METTTRAAYFTCVVCKHRFLVKGAKDIEMVATHPWGVMHRLIGRVCPLPPYRDSQGYWKS